MLPVKLEGSEVRKLSGAGMELAVITSRGLCFSAWSPSAEDLSAMGRGEPLWLVQKGSAIPAQHMVVGVKSAVIPPDMREEAVKTNTPAFKQLTDAVTRKHDSQRKLENAVAIILGSCFVGWIGLLCYVFYRLVR